MRHYEVYGLTPDQERRLAAAILADPGRQAHRLKKRDVLAAALDYLHNDHDLHRFLHEEWEARLFPH
jgi:hypothetical protein